MFQLVLTFALLLILLDVEEFNGETSTTGDAVSAPSTRFRRANSSDELPDFNVFVILVGSAVVAGLFWFFERTKTGRIIRATALDREMATAIASDRPRVTLVFALGAFLACFAGAMAVPPTSATLAMGTVPPVLSFVVMLSRPRQPSRGVRRRTSGRRHPNLIDTLYPPGEITAPFATWHSSCWSNPKGVRDVGLVGVCRSASPRRTPAYRVLGVEVPAEKRSSSSGSRARSSFRTQASPTASSSASSTRACCSASRRSG
ncbi:hypothetical protein C8039_03320 [Halogeometricum sp. wsp3]|nr:hypothetical protein C8039_03320 [Halogeometricum sp. wsp3]